MFPEDRSLPFHTPSNLGIKKSRHRELGVSRNSETKTGSCGSRVFGDEADSRLACVRSNLQRHYPGMIERLHAEQRAYAGPLKAGCPGLASGPGIRRLIFYAAVLPCGFASQLRPPPRHGSNIVLSANHSRCPPASAPLVKASWSSKPPRSNFAAAYFLSPAVRLSRAAPT